MTEESNEVEKCKFCRETILKDAPVCRYCGREQLTDLEIKQLKKSNFFMLTVPIGILLSIILLISFPTIGAIFLIIVFPVLYFILRKRELKADKSLAELQRKNIEYKFKFLFVGLALLLCLSMIMTNPQKKDIYEHIRAEYSILKNIKIIEVEDELFFSYYSVDIGLLSKERHYYVGILNRIFELDAKRGEKIFKPKKLSERERRNR